MAKKKISHTLMQALSQKRLWIVLVLGFFSGLPLLLTGGTLKIWLTRESMDISTIGYFGWVGMAYSLKFLWAPLMDSYTPSRLGRRKSWLLISQLALVAGLGTMALWNPSMSLMSLAAVSILVSFFSATQDIVIDAYRRELIPSEELGIASSLNIYGYRIAMLVSGGLGISLVGEGKLNLSWNQLYYVMAAVMAAGALFTLYIPEPKAEHPHPKGFKEAVLDPFLEFLTRRGAWTILIFVMMFKFGDAMAGAMLNPFYVKMGFSNADIGLIAKSVGLASSLAGLFLGGVAIFKWGVYRCLWIFGILQALSTASFGLLTHTGPATWALAAVVIFEDVSSGMGSSAFVAWLAALTNKRYSATQYAALSSVATLGRNFFSGFSGRLIEALDWEWFFYTCGLLAIPGLFMLWMMSNLKSDQTS